MKTNDLTVGERYAVQGRPVEVLRLRVPYSAQKRPVGVEIRYADEERSRVLRAQDIDRPWTDADEAKWQARHLPGVRT